VQSLKTGVIALGGSRPPSRRDDQQACHALKYDPTTSSSTLNSRRTKTTLFQERRCGMALTYALDREAMLSDPLRPRGRGRDFEPQSFPGPMRRTRSPPSTPTYPTKANGCSMGPVGVVSGRDGIRAKDGKKTELHLLELLGRPSRGRLSRLDPTALEGDRVDCIPKTEEFSTFVGRLTESHDFEAAMVASVGVSTRPAVDVGDAIVRRRFNLGSTPIRRSTTSRRRRWASSIRRSARRSISRCRTSSRRGAERHPLSLRSTLRVNKRVTTCSRTQSPSAGTPYMVG
jgi:hypothetical protein